MILRRATISDGDRVVSLLMEAMGDISYTLSGTIDNDATKHILKSFFEHQDNRISHTNCIVCEWEGEVCAAMACYGGDKADNLELFILQHLAKQGCDVKKLDKECFEDEFYIDSIAVDKRFRSKGVATKMLFYALEQAGKLGYKKASLIVSKDKPKTKQYYEKLGFKADGMLSVNKTEYFHMTQKP